MTIRSIKRAGALVGMVAIAASFCDGARAQTATPIAVTGQVLDDEKGFLFFTTGDGFRIAPGATVVDYQTKRPLNRTPEPRSFVRAVFDASGSIVSIELANHRLPAETSYAAVKKFAVAQSLAIPNPDLAPPYNTGAVGSSGYREALNGQPVIVTFVVQVPPNTPFGDAVYISTDQSGWDPQALRMDRIDALHYRVVRRLNSGTIFHYRYTRGSAFTAERGENFLERPPRLIEVTNLDVKNRADVVYHWGDESINGQTINPLAIPTPFNPNPFNGLPPGPRPTATPPH